LRRVARHTLGFKLATLVHGSLHNVCPQYFLSVLHENIAPAELCLNLLFQHPIHIALASLGFLHADPSIWNSLPPNLRSIDSNTAFNLISKLTYTLMRAFLEILAPNISFHALLIRHNLLTFLRWNYIALRVIIILVIIAQIVSSIWSCNSVSSCCSPTSYVTPASDVYQFDGSGFARKPQVRYVNHFYEIQFHFKGISKDGLLFFTANNKTVSDILMVWYYDGQEWVWDPFLMQRNLFPSLLVFDGDILNILSLYQVTYLINAALQYRPQISNSPCCQCLLALCNQPTMNSHSRPCMHTRDSPNSVTSTTRSAILVWDFE